MMNKRRVIINTVFLVIVFSITFYYIFHGQDINGLMQNISNADVKYWVLAIVCVVLFIVIESIIIFYMMKTIRQKINIIHCFLYSFVGFFFCCVTPAAAGGQPAQLYFMKKDRVPLPVATLILLIITITYKMVLVVLGAIVLIIRPSEIMTYLKPVLGLCYLGLFLNTFSVCFMLLLVFHPTMAKSQLTALVRFLGKVHLLRRTEHYLLKIEAAMQEYKDIALYFKSHRFVIWNVFLMTIIQRVLLFYVTYLTYQSFGLNGASCITIVALQGMISVAVDMLPLPGGMGISEKLFHIIFTPIFGSITLPALIVSRGLSYYTQLIICAVFTVVAFLLIGRKHESK